MALSTRACKAKGRRLQDYVRDTFRYIFKDKLEEDDIKCAIMGCNGTDIILSPAAKKLIPFSIECKNTERINIWQFLEQSEKNCLKNTFPLLIFTRNRSKKYVTLEFDTFLQLLYPEFDRKLLVETQKNVDTE